MYRRFISICTRLLLLSALCASYMCYSSPIYSAPYTGKSEEEQSILQQSLSILEIDREIERIELQQQETSKQWRQVSNDLKSIEEKLALTRERAGLRIRAYYTGEREELLGALLSANNWRSLIRMLDYYQMIIERDRDLMATLKTEQAKLSEAKTALATLSNELSQTRSSLLEQRTRIAELERNVESSLKASADPEHLKKLIEEMTAYWKTAGLKELRRYFQALASAMSGFQDFLTENPDSFVAEKNSYVLTIREEELNEFLHSRNELLKNISFSFEQGKMIASGSGGQLHLQVEGEFSLQDEPEHAILFHVQRLVFNGLELPDTTRNELEREFDLGFYPKKIIPFMKATEATIHQGTLVIKLKLSL